MSTTETPAPRRTRPETWLRYAAVMRRQLARGIDHNEVVGHVRDEGHLSGRYIFMTVMSCAVATLGLLLSSPAVIIGAMLISPLMGPIMALGFSLTILEWAALRKALVAQFWGVAAAIAISFLIVWLSPLREVTPEIVARSRPNLFDLLVAIFSGLAGGYAVIHRKGETIVGVAIATALMPPLAAVGYGLAVGNLDIAGGAFFLFMTNLLAIAFCVVGLSKLYGFGEEHSPRHTLWQSTLILSVFGALSVPLGVALSDIAYETTLTNQVRARILDPFPANDAKVSEFAVNFARDGTVRVNATVMTHETVPDADTRLEALLNTRIDRPVSVRLDQIIMNEGRSLETEALLALADNSLAAPLRSEIRRVEQLATRYATNSALAAAIPFPVTAREMDNETRRAVFVAAASDAFSLGAFREMEDGLGANFPDWTLIIVPPVMELPDIGFAESSAELDQDALAALELVGWALSRWQVGRVEITGHIALPAGRGGDLARARAESVAFWLGQQGFDARTGTAFRAVDADTGAGALNTVAIAPLGGTARASLQQLAE